MKVSFVLNCGLYSKTGKVDFVLKTQQCFKFRMFENGKPDIAWKMVKRFHLKRTPIIILIEKKFKIGNCSPYLAY